MLYPSLESHIYALHANLAKHNLTRMAAGKPNESWESDERSEFEYRILEGHYLEELRTSVQPLIPEKFTSTQHFISWFEALAENGPGQQHRLLDWLANDCTLAQMKWFIAQEAASKAGFDDLLAYTQVQLPAQAKLECARNFWDEMGRGKQGATQAILLERMLKGLNITPSINSTVWESLALSNTMIGLATTRRYTYQALGALGVIELISSQQAATISQGMQRLGIGPWTRSYFDLHAALNVAHSRSWIKEVLQPLVAADPECAQSLAEGALMRLKCGQLCFDRYSSELGLTENVENIVVPCAPAQSQKNAKETVNF